MTERFNQTVLMTDANNFGIHARINPHYNTGKLNLKQARVEHAALVDIYKQAGINVIQVPSPTGSQDGIYTANWALVRGNKAVMSHLPAARKAEEAYAKKILTNLGKQIITLPSELRYSGQGDALACGNYLFCGSGYRSDVKAHNIAAKELGYTPIHLQTIPLVDKSGKPTQNQYSGWPDSNFYDIDLAMAVIKQPTAGAKGLIAYVPKALKPQSRQFMKDFNGVDKIIIDYDEAREHFAANLVSTGEAVIVAGDAPKLCSELSKLGLQVITANLQEIIKGGGFIRCTSLTLD